MTTTLMGARISAHAQKIDELFVTQAARFTFHHNDTENNYRMEESRLSSLMLDKSVSDEKHLEYAKAIVSRSDSYKRDFVRPLWELNEEIQRELLSFEQMLDKDGTHQGDASKGDATVERWLSLSKELYDARIMAIQSIESQTEFETYIPNIIIQNSGRADLRLSAEQSKQFTEGIAGYAALMKVSHEANERIQQEREPLTKLLFPVERSASQTASPARAAISIHPLEGKGWFRFVKVVYIAAWIVGLGTLALFSYAAGAVVVLLVGGGILAIVLVVLKKAFYYVTLGRLTATEQPGKGCVDLEDLRNDLAKVQASSPDVYQEIIAPFFKRGRSDTAGGFLFKKWTLC